MTAGRTRLVNLVLYQVAWFAAVWGAGSGHGDVGALAALALSAVHVSLVTHRRREALWLIAAAGVGLLVDASLVASSVIEFPDATGPLAPPFMTALWVSFATLFHFSLSWLRGRWWLGAALGAVGGPLAYASGAGLSAVRFELSAGNVLATASAWAVAMMVLLHLSRAFDPHAMIRYRE